MLEVLKTARPAGRAALLLALAAGAAQAQVPAFASTAARPAPAASAATPAATPAATSLSAGDNAVRVLLMADTETVLLSQSIGRIITLNGGMGARVRKGQLVVALDCNESAGRLRMAQAELASARDTYDTKVRLKGLDAAGEVDVQLAASAVAKAEGQIQMTQAQVQNCSVHAPFDGRIAKLHVKPFQGVTAGQPLVELVREGPPRLRLNVPSRWLRSLKVGTPLRVEVDETGKTYPATVSAVNARVDAVAQTIEIEARISGSHAELLPGMSGTARFGAF
ncbi:MAG TPA: efflux RND transporter periplasmic adaptor subunit [Ramlibacter sp.]|jgi:RND family efflux transporter MFP subunit|uniref:efflux RND transporter periplasmic adaptor subunit n=1 Tax=Ramlibacter sp. TaxID=1917967 RepID=UPI002D4198AC|nr:efflux RND transporter periplasmic adaptor subunit [Ramlibacter sp.]HZY18583.1 efflux RND transporter periplasmic adaptor subunit [Ramlibacter sp.]